MFPLIKKNKEGGSIRKLGNKNHSIQHRSTLATIAVHLKEQLRYMITNKTNIFMLSPSRLSENNDNAKRRKINLSLMKKRVEFNNSELDSKNRHCYGFTLGFNSMFEDHSLNKESRKKLQLDKIVKKMEREVKLSEIRRMEEDKKLKLALLYKKKWDVRVKNLDEYTPEKLEAILSKKASIKQQKNAVTKIQAFIRGHLQRKRYKELRAKRDNAAKYIHKIWKRYRMITMVPRAWRAKKHMWMTLIQKYIRGFLVHKRVFKEMNNLKLKDAFDYFETIKNDLLVDAQITIRYNWIKYKKAKKKKKKKKGKKKGATKEPSKVVPKEPAKDASFSSMNSTFKKGKATYTNPGASPSKNSQASESPKKTDLPKIPENIPPGTFGINIESTGFTDKTEKIENVEPENPVKQDKVEDADGEGEGEGDNEIKMEFS